MYELFASTVYVLAIGGVAGYFTGFMIKKLLHLALTIGIFAFFLMYMIHTKAIDLNLDEIVANITRFADVLGPLGIASLASSAPFVGSFVVGLIFALRRG